MANTPGSKKAVRKIARRTEVNTARRSRVRTFLRKFEEAVTAGDAAVAKDAFVKAQSELMRAVTKGGGPQEHRSRQGLAPGRPAEEDVAPPKTGATTSGGVYPLFASRNSEASAPRGAAFFVRGFRPGATLATKCSGPDTGFRPFPWPKRVPRESTEIVLAQEKNHR
jgi:small subunit ribosomal protein S20